MLKYIFIMFLAIPSIGAALKPIIKVVPYALSGVSFKQDEGNGLNSYSHGHSISLGLNIVECQKYTLTVEPRFALQHGSKKRTNFASNVGIDDIETLDIQYDQLLRIGHSTATSSTTFTWNNQLSTSHRINMPGVGVYGLYNLNKSIQLKSGLALNYVFLNVKMTNDNLEIVDINDAMDGIIDGNENTGFLNKQFSFKKDKLIPSMQLGTIFANVVKNVDLTLDLEYLLLSNMGRISSDKTIIEDQDLAVHEGVEEHNYKKYFIAPKDLMSVKLGVVYKF